MGDLGEEWRWRSGPQRISKQQGPSDIVPAGRPSPQAAAGRQSRYDEVQRCPCPSLSLFIHQMELEDTLIVGDFKATQ